MSHFLREGNRAVDCHAAMGQDESLGLHMTMLRPPGLELILQEDRVNTCKRVCKCVELLYVIESFICLSLFFQNKKIVSSKSVVACLVSSLWFLFLGNIYYGSKFLNPVAVSYPAHWISF